MPHDLSVLVALLPPKFRPQLDRKDQKLLTDYATIRRYPDPGGAPEISLTEARKAVAMARRVRRELRKHLPKPALRRKKK